MEDSTSAVRALAIVCLELAEAVREIEDLPQVDGHAMGKERRDVIAKNLAMIAEDFEDDDLEMRAKALRY